MSKIDWMQSSQDDRRILYRHAKAEADRQDLNIQSVLEAVVQREFSADYAANMRSGRFSKKYAVSLLDWLESRNPERAVAAVNEILLGGATVSGAWETLISKTAQPIEIVPITARGLNVVGFTSGVPTYEIERGRHFYFRIDCKQPGFAVAFQKFASVWYPLFLGRNQQVVPVKAGRNELPRTIDGDDIDPICEETEIGTVEFVLFVMAQLLQEQELSPGVGIPTSKLDQLANAFERAEIAERLLTRLLVT